MVVSSIKYPSDVASRDFQPRARQFSNFSDFAIRVIRASARISRENKTTGISNQTLVHATLLISHTDTKRSSEILRDQDRGV